MSRAVRLILTLVSGLMLFGLAKPPRSAFALAETNANLYVLARDSAGLTQLGVLDATNTFQFLTASASDLVGYDVAANGFIATVSARELTVNGLPVTAGGPLDSPALSLLDVAWSPRTNQVAVVAGASGAADPSAGVWLYDITTTTWQLLLTSTSADPATSIVYNGVDWGTSGDRLILDATFGDGTRGVTLYSLSTGHNLPINRAGTGNIDSAGYSRGNLSLEGNRLLISDVPNSPTGNAYIVDVNDLTRIIPVVGDDLAANRYISHVLPVRGGLAYFVRDYGNAITTTEVWQLSAAGARVALGNLPDINLGRVADWNESGTALVYTAGGDEATGFGTAKVFVRQGDIMTPVTLPTNLPAVKEPRWGAERTLTFTQVSAVSVTEPLFEFTDEAGLRYYSLRLQWNAVAGGNGTYRLSVSPDFAGQSTFDIQGVAARFNRLPCKTTYTIQIAALDATGAAGPFGPALEVSTPPCDAPVFAVTQDLYAGGAPAPANPAPVPTTEPVAAPPPANPAPAALPTSAPIETGVDQGGASTVIGVTAGLPTPTAVLANGQQGYSLQLSWAPPAQAVRFFIVRVSPAFGDNLRDRLPVRAEGNPITATVDQLYCGVNYTFVIQSYADDGRTVLSNAEPVSVQMPPC